LKVAFLDRDGTINKSFWTCEHAGGPEFWEGPAEPILLPGTAEGLRHLRAKGYELIIITNQYPIGEGQVTQAFYDEYTEKLLALLKKEDVDILDVFFCPHRRDAGCACCKPRPGMILKAARKHGIDLSHSVLIGDKQSDIEAGRRAGLARCLFYKAQA
jgi:D-glycero-D-manno-heptose 1,7-bisphosphate phosphatase